MFKSLDILKPTNSFKNIDGTIVDVCAFKDFAAFVLNSEGQLYDTVLA